MTVEEKYRIIAQKWGKIPTKELAESLSFTDASLRSTVSFLRKKGVKLAYFRAPEKIEWKTFVDELNEIIE